MEYISDQLKNDILSDADLLAITGHIKSVELLHNKRFDRRYDIYRINKKYLLKQVS